MNANKISKRKHWNSIKDEFLSKIPDTYKVELADIDKTDSKYYHPTIDLGNGYQFYSQCDTEANYVYGMRIQKQITTNGYIKTVSIDLDSQNAVEEFFKNKFDNFNVAQKYIDMAISLELLKSHIDEVIKDLTYYAYYKEIQGIKLRKTEREIKNNLESLLIEIDKKL